jgi:hypothetical protein
MAFADINEQFSFNHNAIRQHLVKLVAAGRVLESTARAAGHGSHRLVHDTTATVTEPFAHDHHMIYCRLRIRVDSLASPVIGRLISPGLARTPPRRPADGSVTSFGVGTDRARS